MDRATVEALLDLTRWAPSGDNQQPWRFSILEDGDHWRLETLRHTKPCVYDLDGRASQLSLGMLIETLEIAASLVGLRPRFERRGDALGPSCAFDIHWRRDERPAANPLAALIQCRSVQRRAMSTRPLAAAEKAELEAVLEPGNKLIWLEGLAARARAARLLFQSTALRLRMPEAYPVHRAVIQWDARFSEDRIPDRALGLDRLSLALMRHAMSSWWSMDFCVRFLGASLLPRIEMDLIPGLACAAHFVMVADEPPVTPDHQIQAGRSAQRFWLTATRLGLQLQPTFTPLVFARYAREGVRFSQRPGLDKMARDLDSQLTGLIGEEAAARGVFMGRIGFGPAASSRSLRRPVSELMASPPQVGE